ncbi:putative Mitochondrial carrier-like protein 2 [Hypsibius exemplaris]|uniref:Mitochondrial carrier-like protein 2 n=1 Tax=Hypsibius exemplaris TaxID=2072580 RepID=A0A9X6RLM5_HYPEX|nr:putative Mitochondrial carrier-like protein 2 [Hypsibius exemplaris]
MAHDQPAVILHELLHEVNPPNRTHAYDRATSATIPDAKDEEAVVRAARFDMVVRWAIYGGQVAASTALFHPFACARVLMDLGYEPVAPTLSRTLFGKPCLVLPNITSYVRFMRNRDGRGALWRGFGANFCGVLVGNLTNDIAYHLVDEFIKRKVRSSPRKAWSVFVVAHQENARYSPADFAEDLTKEVLARTAGLTLAYPFQVVFLRVVSQFVWKERVYTGLSDSFLQIYRQEGIRGLYSGFVPFMVSEIGALVLVWIAAYAFRSVVTGDRIWLTIFRFAADYMMRTVLYPFKLVGRMMAISPAPLKIVSPPLLPKFAHWRDCFAYLKMQNSLMRGSNIFMRIVNVDKFATASGKPGSGADSSSSTFAESVASSLEKASRVGRRLPSEPVIAASIRAGGFSEHGKGARFSAFGGFRTSF